MHEHEPTATNRKSVEISTGKFISTFDRFDLSGDHDCANSSIDQPVRPSRASRWNGPSPTHKMSTKDFAAVASGLGGASAIRQLAAVRRSRTLVLLRSVVGHAARNGHPEATRAAEALSGLGALPRPVVDALIGHPGVGAWALRTAILLNQRDARADPGFLACVLAAAHARGGVPGVVALPLRTSIALPSLGTVLFPGVTGKPVRLVVSEHGAVVSDGLTSVPLDATGAPYWRPCGHLHAEHRGERLSLVIEADPALRMTEGVVIHDHLPETEAAGWHERITEGWHLLVSHHGDVAEEVAEALTVLTPLHGRAGGQISATFAESFGCVAMSLPKDAAAAALTLTHEVQHGKLSAVTDLFPLVKQDTGQLLYAPWRRDPRPPNGLLQGAYAHLGVARFWRTRLHYAPDHEAEVEFTRWREGGLDAVASLADSGTLTPEGEAYVAHMVHTFEAWRAEPTSSKATAEARRRNREHLARWTREHRPT